MAVKLPDEANFGALHFCGLVRNKIKPGMKIFVAGCGSGREALRIHTELGLDVTGMDIAPRWDWLDTSGVDTSRFRLIEGSILNIPFPDQAFDMVFYHHVIEHVQYPARSILELSRILVPGGELYVGTPNRNRMIGYLGSEASLSDKLRWNMADYKARMRMRFRNEFGAHAGFSEKELREMLRPSFTDIRSLTADYLDFKYAHKLPPFLLKAICTPPLVGVVPPSVYLIASKANR